MSTQYVAQYNFCDVECETEKGAYLILAPIHIWICYICAGLMPLSGFIRIPRSIEPMISNPFPNIDQMFARVYTDFSR